MRYLFLTLILAAPFLPAPASAGGCGHYCCRITGTCGSADFVSPAEAEEEASPALPPIRLDLAPATSGAPRCCLSHDGPHCPCGS